MCANDGLLKFDPSFFPVDLGECRDTWACKTFFKGKCNVWSNTKIRCPKMCGVCTPGKNQLLDLEIYQALFVCAKVM